MLFFPTITREGGLPLGVHRIGQAVLRHFSSGLTTIPAVLPRLTNGQKASLTILYVGNSGITRAPVDSTIFDGVTAVGLKENEVRLLTGLQEITREQNPPTIITQIPAGPYTVCSNRVRSLRDTRIARAEHMPLLKPFDVESSFIQTHPAEEFIRFQFRKTDFRLLYNLFPFAPYHFILVPAWEDHLPQYINPSDPLHRSIVSTTWDLLHELAQDDPRFRIGYNALGGHASRNQLHFHGFIAQADTVKLPFEDDARLVTVGSPRAIDDFIWIPARDNSKNVSAVAHLMSWVEVMHSIQDDAVAHGELEDRVSYNFYMIPNQGIAFFPRKHQGNHRYVDAMAAAPFEQAPLTTGLAFFEYLKAIVCPHRSAFDTLMKMTESERVVAIERVFLAARLSPLPSRALRLLN